MISIPIIIVNLSKKKQLQLSNKPQSDLYYQFKATFNAVLKKFITQVPQLTLLR